MSETNSDGLVRLEKKIDRVLEEIQDLTTWQQTHQETHKIVDRDITELRGEIYGRGPVAGLKTRMQTVEQCNRPQSTTRQFILNVAQQVTSALIITLIAWLMFLYKYVAPEGK